MLPSDSPSREKHDLFLTWDWKEQEYFINDLFENKDYKFFFEASVWEEYEDLVYYVSWGEYDKTCNEALKKNLKLNEIVRPSGEGIMHVCAEYGRADLFNHFSWLGHNLLMKNYALETPFHIAAREGKIEILKLYLDSYSFTIDQTMIDGWTALHYAALNGYTRSVEFLVEWGANIDALDKFKRTALHWATRFDNQVVVSWLLHLGISYWLRDVEGMSAFDLAWNKKFYEVARIINEYHKKRQRMN